MGWIEKGQPTPFDMQPISGLLFLDGDLIARTQEPGLPRDWAQEFQGLKYPVIIFPSGAEASVTTDDAEQILVCIHRQMRLPYFDTRERAYERATALAEDHQEVDRVGETSLALRLDDPNQHVLVTYDNQAGHMIDLGFEEDKIDEVARLLALKTEITDRFGRLPPEHQATMGLVLVKTIMDGEWGSWFRDALTARFTIGENALVPPYMHTINREDLRRTHLTEDEIDQLSDTDMTTIAKLIHEHFITDAFWDELEFITDLVLAGKKRKP